MSGGKKDSKAPKGRRNASAAREPALVRFGQWFRDRSLLRLQTPHVAQARLMSPQTRFPTRSFASSGAETTTPTNCAGRAKSKQLAVKWAVGVCAAGECQSAAVIEAHVGRARRQ